MFNFWVFATPPLSSFPYYFRIANAFCCRFNNKFIINNIWTACRDI